MDVEKLGCQLDVEAEVVVVAGLLGDDDVDDRRRRGEVEAGQVGDRPGRLVGGAAVGGEGRAGDDVVTAAGACRSPRPARAGAVAAGAAAASVTAGAADEAAASSSSSTAGGEGEQGGGGEAGDARWRMEELPVRRWSVVPVHPAVAGSEKVRHRRFSIVRPRPY